MKRSEMKIIGRFAALCAAALAATTIADAREFKNSDGKTIEADLVAYVGKDQVRIRIEGGREMVAPIAAFSAEDQEFIRKWIKESPDAIEYSFDIQIKDSKQDGKRTENYFEKMKLEDWAYEVEVTNRGRIPARDLTLKYKIYMEDRVNQYGTFLRAPELLYKEGEAKISELEYNNTAKFLTKTHLMHTVRNKYSFYNKSNERDRLRGVWVRFYRGDTMVHEWKSPEVPVESWDIEKPRSTSGRPESTASAEDDAKKVNPFAP